MVPTRRQFLEQVGQGVLIAGIGSTACAELGLATLADTRAADEPDRLNFGKQEPLVRLLQETPADKLLPLVVERLGKGTTLRELTAAAALANARKFGGEDYIGYHTLMALPAAHAMSGELPSEKQALPVLKVLYRNSARIQAKEGGEKLAPVEPASLPEDVLGSEALRAIVRKRDLKEAERTFAALAKGTATEALDHLLPVVQDETEVHRIVLAYRAWDMIDLVGKAQAHTMLRQSVRYCVDAERWPRRTTHGDSRTVLAKLLEKHKLLVGEAGKKKLDDAGVEKLSERLFESKPEDAAGIVAEALAYGVDPDAIGQAITLAACELVLRDAGRPKGQTGPGKPEGSVHGDSIGVHALDSANAWRNLSRVSNRRNSAACLILGAFQVALDRLQRGGDFLTWKPYPREEHTAKITTKDAAALLKETEGCIKENDQIGAAARAGRYLALGHAEKDLFALLLEWSISQDGALHAEKFYRTVREEHAVARAGVKKRYVVALARVVASAYGTAAPGHVEACRLLKT